MHHIRQLEGLEMSEKSKNELYTKRLLLRKFKKDVELMMKMFEDHWIENNYGV
jgi:hypothetical protein